MHSIFASKRLGDHNNFERGVAIKTDDRVYAFAAKMVTRFEDGRRRRYGTFVNETGNVIWESELVEGPTPFRALMQTAGLCDADGETKDVELPAWLTGATSTARSVSASDRERAAEWVKRTLGS